MNGMIWTIAVVVFTSGFFGPQMNWRAQGNRALDAGNPRQAAAAFARGLDVRLRTGAPAEELLHLRVRLATALMEAGQDRQAEATLQEAGKSAALLASGLARAELLNVWSALHLKRGQLSAAEGELQDAWRIGAQSPEAGDFRATVLHNLAAVEMRTGRYAEALGCEREAIRMWEHTLNPDHPNLIRAYASLASLEYMMGQPRNGAGTRVGRQDIWPYAPSPGRLAGKRCADPRQVEDEEAGAAREDSCPRYQERRGEYKRRSSSLEYSRGGGYPGASADEVALPVPDSWQVVALYRNRLATRAVE